ncbi:MAG: hypothetical protein OER90_17105 [Gemmatimonadota bacterium]|nr:hypothetical protein [Gemmatimonadota bacterium]
MFGAGIENRINPEEYTLRLNPADTTHDQPDSLGQRTGLAISDRRARPPR